MEVTKQDLEHVEFNRLMEAFPQNALLVREFGRWVIYRDKKNSSIPAHEQGAGQKFSDFIIEFFVDEMRKEYAGDYGFLDIVIEITMAMARYKKYRNRLTLKNRKKDE